MPRTIRRAAPLIAAAFVLWPLIGSPHDDSYPLSTYPMFADEIGAEITIDTVVVLDESGAVDRLSPTIISGTDEIVTASVVVSRAIRRGDSEVLCAEVARRVADPDLRVQVRSELVDTVAVVRDGADPLSVTIWAECMVGQ